MTYRTNARRWRQANETNWEKETNWKVNLMSRQKQLDLLSSGKTLRDTWRRASHDGQTFEPDRYGIDLPGANLQEVASEIEAMERWLDDGGRSDNESAFGDEQGYKVKQERN